MLVQDAAAYAIAAHGAQTYGDRPYAEHLSGVAAILEEWGADPEIVAAGWLHDVIEDTAASFADLSATFGQRVAEAVWAVTAEGDTRAEKMAAIYRKAIPRCCVGQAGGSDRER